MKLIRFIAFLFYNYYSTGSRADIKYFSSLMALTGLSFIHVAQVLVLLDKFQLIVIPYPEEKGSRYLYVFLIVAPIYFLFRSLIKEENLKRLQEHYDYNWDKVFNANVWLVLYIILSFTLLVFLIIWKR